MIDAQSNYVNVVVIGTQRHGKWQEVTEQHRGVWDKQYCFLIGLVLYLHFKLNFILTINLCSHTHILTSYHLNEPVYRCFLRINVIVNSVGNSSTHVANARVLILLQSISLIATI